MSVREIDGETETTENRADDSYIQIQNVTKTFAGGSVIAAEDINLDIGKSEFVVLLGPSGCGKTTTLRCIAGLDIPDSGQITVDGEDITNKKPKDRGLAFVFQSIALFPHMTVRENIRFGLDMISDRSAQEKEERVAEVADMLGIAEMLDRKPTALSGGQQQRVSLGRAMIMDPAAFLLDEPFSALDANLRDRMRVEVKKLQRQLETAMIFVTHDQEEAMTIGDKIVVINDANIQQIGSPYEIFNDPKNRFVADFIGSPTANFFDCVVSKDDGAVRFENDLFTMPLPEEKVDGFAGENGDRVTIGIRPDFVEVAQNSALFEADVNVIEPHGARDTVYLETGDVEIRVTTEQNAVEQDAISVSVDFERDRIWVFDEAGERLV